jgi:tryptophan-rich sensory protein
MNESLYKRVFLIGALWNIAGEAFITLFAGWIFSTANMTPPQPPAYFHSWIVLFVTFGIGYYMVYRNMYGNKDIVILGIIGKVGFAIIFIYNILAFKGQVPLFFLIPVIGDLVFAVLFGMFLDFAKKTGKG